MSYEKKTIIDFATGKLVLEGRGYSGQPVRYEFAVSADDLGDIVLSESTEDSILRYGNGAARIVQQGPIQSLEVELTVMDVIE